MSTSHPKLETPPFILLSGGIDSTALLAQLVLKENVRPRGLFLDVGQNSAKRQLTIVKQLSLRYNIAVDTPKVNLVELFHPLIDPPHPLLTENSSPDVLKPEEPVASAALTTIASFFTALAGAKVLYYPATLEDKSVVPKLEKISNLVAQVVQLNTGFNDFSISMPYIRMSHAEVLNTFHSLETDVDTWSCNWGGPFHCGGCVGCHVRKNRFATAGQNDKTIYRMDYSS